MRPLILCADDFALSPGVSRGIVELLDAGRLSATSCMSVSPLWPEHAGWLAPLRVRADIGLHLTLTGLVPLGAMPRTAPGGRLPGLGRLLALSLSRRLDADEVAAELTRQLDAFETAFGAPPDFIDGHQHVHQLPVVRDAVLALYRRRLAGSGCWIRLCAEPAAAILARGVDRRRALVIALLGRRFAAAVRAGGVPANDSFRGVTDFSDRVPYGVLFARFLTGGGRRPLVMCHPGHVDAALAAVDAVTVRRQQEWDYLSSPAFPAVLAAAGYRLARFTDAP